MRVFYLCALVTLASAGCESGGDTENGSTPPGTVDSGAKLDGGGPTPDGTDVASGDQDAADSSDDPVIADISPDTAAPPAYDLSGVWKLTTSGAPGIIEKVVLAMESDGTLNGEVDHIEGYKGWLRGTDFFLRHDWDHGDGPGYFQYTGTAQSKTEIKGEYEGQSESNTGKGTGSFLMTR